MIPNQTKDKEKDHARVDDSQYLVSVRATASTD